MSSPADAFRQLPSVQRQCEVSGALAPVDAQVSFRLRPEDAHNAGKVAIVSTASRPGMLDNNDRPKHLLQLRGESIIRHVLRQLWQGGVDKVILVVGWKGDLILEDLQDCPSLNNLEIDVVNLGEHYHGGFARSLLAASTLRELPADILLCTADHVFSAEILRRIREKELAAEEGVRVLVELDPKLSHSGELPHTAVRVVLDPQSGRLTQISQDLHEFDGVEAGLFWAKSVELFSCLQQMAQELSYFSLAQCLQRLCSEGRLSSIATEGLNWFGLETDLALDTANQPGTKAALFNGEVLTGKRSSITNLHDLELGLASVEVNLILGFTVADAGQVSVVADSDITRHVGGFMIGVQDLPPLVDEAMTRGGHEQLLKQQPCLSEGISDVATLAPMSQQTKTCPDLAAGYVLSIPTALCASELHPVDAVDGYLIGMPETGSTSSNYVFAVPEITESSLQPETQTFADRFELPTDVVDVTIERTRARSDSVLKDGSGVVLSVNKSVPAVGWLMLGISLISCSAMGPLVDLQKHCTPLAKILWRSTVAAFGFIIAAHVAEAGNPKYRENLTDCNVLKLLLMAWGGWLVYMGGFQIAASLTSVTHTYLFGQMVGVFIVLQKLITRQPVSRLELMGVGMAACGAGLCLLDKGGGGDNSPSITGDMVALGSAAGGCVFLQSAKEAKARVNTYVFYSLMHCWTMLLLFVVCGITLRDESWDSEAGLFGWMHPTPITRLPIQMILFFVCDFIGLCGYVFVMKYFDPLLVSLVMLLEPIVGTAEGIALGVSVFPGLFSVGGACTMFLGIGLVSNGAKSSSVTVDASSALQHHNDNNVAMNEKGDEEEREDLVTYKD